MEKLTLLDLCTYIRNAIRNNQPIYQNYYGGFVNPGAIVVHACRYSNMREVCISKHAVNLIRREDPAVEIKINDFSDEDWLEYQKALLELRRYNENTLINEVKGNLIKVN